MTAPVSWRLLDSTQLCTLWWTEACRWDPSYGVPMQPHFSFPFVDVNPVFLFHTFEGQDTKKRFSPGSAASIEQIVKTCPKQVQLAGPVVAAAGTGDRIGHGAGMIGPANIPYIAIEAIPGLFKGRNAWHGKARKPSSKCWPLFDECT
ncbi:hypothetical protein TW95_gp0794 [Pandoravirus inopinatum]|uniref:Uncharacterized protein n=1 Tax=Pandoravirus inopinatum TaxID=1605721 RepID=A0A0B5IXM0_9VIRU|nr:hypothetical protein TW95_gp0794 [Pandoravirus inopinatum]AJF97528.1 hypothetical protein [Pandoravirus inopinatum]